MDDDIHRPITPSNASEAKDDSDESDSDAESPSNLSFDETAEDDLEASKFEEDEDGSASSRRMTDSIRNLVGFLQQKRRNASQRVMLGVSSAWVDQDDSGTYNPKRKRATAGSTKVTVKKRKIDSHEGDNEGEGKKWKLYRKVGYSLMVRLTLESEQGREYLRSITPGESDESGTSEDEESETSDQDDGSYNRRRRRRREPERLGATYSRADSLTLGDLTEDHPQRRGCKACFEIGDDECTLIEDKFDYPCEACRDGSIECELIIPPQLKKSCQRCKQKRRSCSYRSDGGKGVETCDECADESVKCVAGPLKGSSYLTRLDKTASRGNGATGQPAAGDTGETERMWVACNQCRDLSIRCSLRGKQDFGPCSHCREKHEECKFVLPPKRRPPPPGVCSPATNTRNLLKEVAVIGYKKGRRDLKKGRRDLRKENQYILKKTFFCNPIQFNYTPDPAGDHPCNWCQSQFFGFFGLTELSGPRTVEGYWLENGEGFMEVSGGFADPGVDGKQAKEPTRMCVGCTFERIRICTCPFHTIRRLWPTEQSSLVWDDAKWQAAVSALESGDEVGGALVLNSKWCSICREPAMFTCSTTTPFTLSGEQKEDEGCGLLLCECCETLTHETLKAGIFSGSDTVDSIIIETRTNKLLHPHGVRADSEFLLSDGELITRIRQGLGLGAGDDSGNEFDAEFEHGTGGYGGQGGHGSKGAQGVQGTQGIHGAQRSHRTPGVQGNQGPQGVQEVHDVQPVYHLREVQTTRGEHAGYILQEVQGADDGHAVHRGHGNQRTQGVYGVQGTQGIHKSQRDQETPGAQRVQGIHGGHAGYGVQGVHAGYGGHGTPGAHGVQGVQAQGGQGVQVVYDVHGARGFQGVHGAPGGQGVQGFGGLPGVQRHAVHEDFDPKQYPNWKGRSTTFNTLSTPSQIPDPAREQQSAGYREGTKMYLYTPTKQRPQPANVWSDELPSMAYPPEMERGIHGYGDVDPRPDPNGKGKGRSTTFNTLSTPTNPRPQPANARSAERASMAYGPQMGGDFYDYGDFDFDSDFDLDPRPDPNSKGKGKGRSTTFNSFSTPHQFSNPASEQRSTGARVAMSATPQDPNAAREQDSTGLRERAKAAMYATPQNPNIASEQWRAGFREGAKVSLQTPMNPRAQVGNAQSGNVALAGNPKDLGRGWSGYSARGAAVAAAAGGNAGSDHPPRRHHQHQHQHNPHLDAEKWVGPPLARPQNPASPAP